jgi:lipopolysaccharide biosynthesis glycosyltransferase
MPFSELWKRGRRRNLHVVCASDAEYLPHCATMLHSLIATQRGPVQVHLLSSAEMTRELGRLSAWVEELGAAIAIHGVDEDRLVGVHHPFSLTSWYRVLIPELLTGLDRALYLDCDLIVTDSLEPLQRPDLSGHLLAAVTNPPFTPEWARRHTAALGMTGTDDYFNCGVLLMNLDGLRAGNWTRRIIEYGMEHVDHARSQEVDESSTEQAFNYGLNHPERLLFPDQDAMNAVLWKHRLKLHPRWNYQLLFKRVGFRTEELTDEVVTEARAKPAIRHFEGPGHSKPWHSEADPADADVYWAHRNQTPWPA